MLIRGSTVLSINFEYAELDGLLHDISKQNIKEKFVENQTSEENTRVNKERVEPEQVIQMSVERLSETI